MQYCGKCGASIEPGTGKMKTIDVGSVNGQPVRALRMVCDSCAGAIERGQKGCMVILLVLAALVGLVYVGGTIYDKYFRDEAAFRYRE